MIHKYRNHYPEISNNAFIAESADVIGKAKIAEDASIWFGAVIRADGNSITIEKGVNIQDNSTVHVPSKYSVYIGEYSSIGHNCVIHGAKIGANTLIGMNSVILDGAEIGDDTIIGAGSLVTAGKKIPSGVLCMGSPAKVIRELTEEEKETTRENTNHYIKVSKEYIK